MPKQFKFYGDEWLCLRDQFDKFNPAEALMTEIQFGFGILQPKEISYLIGEKTRLIAQLAFMKSVNTVYQKIGNRADFETYMKKRNLVLPQQKIKSEQMYG